MDKDRLKEIIIDQQEVFNSRKDLIERDIDLERFINSKQVVVVSGVRRCGKSSLLFLIKEKMNLKAGDYCYFNFDDERISGYKDILDDIYRIHLEHYAKDPVFFLDEIQNIEGWEKFVNRMYEKGMKLFVSGSNANLLSSEISSSLTGRNLLLELFPFSFTELLRYRGESLDLRALGTAGKSRILKAFNEYLRQGGFPLVVKEGDMELINSYFQDILYRDIVARYNLTQVNEIKQIGQYFAANVGKLFSYANLQKISGVKSLSSIKDYLYYYSQTYLFFYLSKFDYSVKKQIMNSKKVYTIDTGIASRIGFNFSENKGRILENIVYLELLRQGKEVYYYSGKKECDFVIKEGLKIKEAIQVCYGLNMDNEEREYQGLQEAMKEFGLKEGTLLTHDDKEETIRIGEGELKLIPVWKWILSTN